MPPDLLVRPALPDELDTLWSIRVAASSDSAPASLPSRPRYLDHLLATGRIVVAERDGDLLGFAGLIERAGVAFLTDLFVDPARQSSAVGRALLDRILPDRSMARMTLSSADHRAMALYARAGMRPRWPNLVLSAPAARIERLPDHGLKVVEASIDDLDLIRFDAEVAGRERAVDLRFMIDGEDGRALSLTRRGARVGYALIRTAAGIASTAGAVVVGPAGALAADDAVACLIAAISYAREMGPIVELALPGPHPALSPLLEARFHIIDADTFCASSPENVSPERYVSSGGDLF